MGYQKRYMGLNLDIVPLYVLCETCLSLTSLRSAPRGRKTETEEALQKRLAAAAAEMQYGETPGNFHATVVNDELEHAYQQLRQFLLPIILQKKANGADS